MRSMVFHHYYYGDVGLKCQHTPLTRTQGDALGYGLIAPSGRIRVYQNRPNYFNYFYIKLWSLQVKTFLFFYFVCFFYASIAFFAEKLLLFERKIVILSLNYDICCY